MTRKTRLLNLVFLLSVCKSRFKRDLLIRLCLLRDNDRHDQVDQCDIVEACEERQQGQQTDLCGIENCMDFPY